MIRKAPSEIYDDIYKLEELAQNTEAELYGDKLPGYEEIEKTK